MRTTSGQNWLQVMRSHAGQPGEGPNPAADVHAASPVPQLRVTGLPGQNMVSLCTLLFVWFMDTTPQSQGRFAYLRFVPLCT